MFRDLMPSAFRARRAAVRVRPSVRVETLERRQLLSTTSVSGPAYVWDAPAWHTSTSASPTQAALTTQPFVTASDPKAGQTGVRRDAFVAAYVSLPNVGAGVDPATLTSSNVWLFKTSDTAKTPIPATLNTTGGGDAIILQPTSLLASFTQYTFYVSAGVKDTSGASFQTYVASFTTSDVGGSTAGTIAFDKVSLSNATGYRFTGVTVGPDNKLYAGTFTGEILRWTINSDGTLSGTTVINSVRNGNAGANRLITGLRFDPSSTASNLILWVTHGYGAEENAVDWTGKLSRLTGSSLGTYVDYVNNFPRSIRDHLTNQMDFGPDGKLYISQASMTAMGAPDNAWGQRSEHLLSAAILRVDTGALATRIANGPGALNVKTSDGGGSYNPYATGAPVTLYATVVRNAYDVLWHSNGNLYAPTNGSAPGGNTPAGGGAPALTNVSQVEPDWLFKVRAGKYYGHPNPTRSEYVLNGGNPTSGTDKYQVNAYPVGVQPDADWDPAIYSFGNNYSPDGLIEYKSSGPFGGALKGSLLVARYSGGDDVIVLTPDSSGNIPSTGVRTGIAGLTGFVDPLDIAEQVGPGNLYVVEHGANKITLLRPRATTTSTQTLNITWTSNAPAAPMKRNEPGAVQVGEKLYVLGGYNGVFDREITSACHVYNLATRTWSQIASLPSDAATTHAGVASDGKYIYVVAGQIGGATRYGTNKSFRYDIAANRWERFTDLPAVRFGGALAYLNGKLHFFGGDAADRVTVQTTHWELDVTTSGGTWQSKAPLPLGGDHIASAVLNGKIYAIGGEHDHGGLTDTTDAKYIQHNYLFEYDPVTDAWTRKADMNVGTSHNEGMVQVINGQIVVMGGMISKDLPTDLVRAYDPVANSWRTLANRLTISRLGGVSGYYNGKIYLTTGVVGSNQAFTTTAYEGTPTTSTTTSNPIAGLTLMNADTNSAIKSLTDGMTVSYSGLGVTNISVRADVSGTIGSVRWTLDGNTSYRIENYAPYLIGGDANGGADVLPWSIAKGTHTITVTAYSAANASGTNLGSKSVTFTIAS
jgi:N-acetylneuraminic acid mutarotase